MTKEERSAVAKRAAAARWEKDLPKVTHKGDMNLNNLVLPCYVLEDERRVISTHGLQLALGMVDADESKPSGTRLGRYLGQKSLQPFIYKGKKEGHYDPISCLNGSSKINGFEATILIDICKAFLDARKEITLSPRQAIIAVQAEILVTAFAKLGVVARVDEATGYQEVRAKDALARILNDFIEEEYRKWTPTFPLEYYLQIARLKGWEVRLQDGRYIWPSVVGHYTNDFIYSRLAPGVLEELKKKNPKMNGRRKQKHHQWVTAEIGVPKLKAMFEGQIMLAKYSTDWNDFKNKVYTEYPRIETTELGFDIQS